MDFSGLPPASPPTPGSSSEVESVFSRLSDESPTVQMEEEDEDWDIIRKPLKTVEDVLDYWDHRLEKVEQFSFNLFKMLFVTFVLNSFLMKNISCFSKFELN